MLDLILLGAIAFAIVRAWRARFYPGLVAAVLRLALIAASAVVIGVSLISSGAPSVGAPVKLGVFLAGPLVTFAMTFVTWRRTKNIPYLQEEAAHRVFMPWVVIACVDAVSIVLLLFGFAISLQA